MRLYTIQPQEVLTQLEAVAELPADATKGQFNEFSFPDGHITEGFQKQYGWLKDQMKLRIPSYQGGDMWWAWKDRPDLRRETACYERGFNGVLITLDVPEEEVLLSDFDAWGMVLNGHYVSYTEEQDARWDAYVAMTPWEEWETMEHEARMDAVISMFRAEPLPEVLEWRAHLQEIIESSWEAIFDDRWYQDAAAKDWSGEAPEFQATFELLRLENVVAVQSFTGRRKQDRFKVDSRPPAGGITLPAESQS